MRGDCATNNLHFVFGDIAHKFWFPKTRLTGFGQVDLRCHPFMSHRQRQFHHTKLLHEFFHSLPPAAVPPSSESGSPYFMLFSKFADHRCQQNRGSLEHARVSKNKFTKSTISRPEGAVQNKMMHATAARRLRLSFISKALLIPSFPFVS